MKKHPKDGNTTCFTGSGASQASEPFSFRESQAPQALHESAPAKFGTLQAAADQAIALGLGPDCVFNFARAIKAWELQHQRRLPIEEFGAALAIWWAKAGLPAEADFDEYLSDLIAGYARAKTALGSHILDNAADAVAPLSEKPTFKERTDRLLSVCRELSKLSADGSFFLGRRDAGEILGNSNPGFIQNVMVTLCAKGALLEIERGTAKGRRATRYKINA